MTYYDPVAIIDDLYRSTDENGIIIIPFMRDLKVRMDWDGKDCRRVKEQFRRLYQFLNEMVTWQDLLSDDAEENSRLLPSAEAELWKKWLCPFDLSKYNRTTLHAIRMKKIHHDDLTSTEQVIDYTLKNDLPKQAEERIGRGLFADQLIIHARAAVRKGSDTACNPDEAETLAILYAIHTCGTEII